MRKSKICTTIYLVLGTALVYADIFSDYWVAAAWWHQKGYQFYACLAVGLLLDSALLSVLVGLVPFVVFGVLKKLYCGGLCACFCGGLNLHGVFFTCVSLVDIWDPKKNPADFWGASSNEVNAKPIAFWKTYEFIFEACPQLLLQTYVATYKFYGPDNVEVQPVLAVSIALSTFSIVNGLANRWLANESLGGYCLGSLFFASMLIARICALVALIIQFGYMAFIVICVVLFAHSCVIDCAASFTISVTADIPLFIAPLGFRQFKAAANRDTSQFWSPFDYDAAKISDVLLSPLGKINFVLHVVGNCVMLLLVANLPSQEDQPEVSGSFLLHFGVRPMVVGIVAYVAAFIIYNQEPPQGSVAVVAQEVDELKDGKVVVQQPDKKVQADCEVVLQQPDNSKAEAATMDV